MIADWFRIFKFWTLKLTQINFDGSILLKILDYWLVTQIVGAAHWIIHNRKKDDDCELNEFKRKDKKNDFYCEKQFCKLSSQLTKMQIL